MIAHEQVRCSRDGRPLAVPTQDCIWKLESQLSRAFVFAGGGIHPARATGHLVVEKNKDPNISAKYEPNQTALYA